MMGRRRKPTYEQKDRQFRENRRRRRAAFPENWRNTKFTSKEYKRKRGWD